MGFAATLGIAQTTGQRRRDEPVALLHFSHSADVIPSEAPKARGRPQTAGR
jgi:hypothetical protein